MSKAKKLRYIAASLFIILALAGYFGTVVYAKIYSNNTDLNGKEKLSFYLPTGTTLKGLDSLIIQANFIVDIDGFWWVAKRKKFSRVYPGHYIIRNNMSNSDLVNMFRSGLQTPVKVHVPSTRTLPELIGRVAKQIEADSASLMNLLEDRTFLDRQDWSKESLPAMFLPDTYELYWNQTAEGFIKQMKKKYTAFWNTDRLKRAKELKLSKLEIATLASIVQSEQMRFNDEKAVIAGLYLNRLRIRMPLDSDPTLIFALGDFSIKRVLDKDKLIDSPYNTYKHYGLPPGPILVPEKSSVNAVLHAKKHKYLFMCAKEDFSGLHNFAKTYNQHLRYAAKYHRAMNKKRILR